MGLFKMGIIIQRNCSGCICEALYCRYCCSRHDEIVVCDECEGKISEEDSYFYFEGYVLCKKCTNRKWLEEARRIL